MLDIFRINILYIVDIIPTQIKNYASIGNPNYFVKMYPIRNAKKHARNLITD